MILPSHLRPPLIVTVGVNHGHSVSRTPSGSATGRSEDHELLELLSNMKSSPNSDLFTISSGRKRGQDLNNLMHNDNRDGTEKRVKMENILEIPRRRKSIDASTPTDRALKRVRSELAKREIDSKKKAEEGGGASDEDSSGGYHNHGMVPFDLLPFFKYLGDNTQRYVC